MGSWDYLAASLSQDDIPMLFPPLLPQMEKMKNPKFSGTPTCTCLCQLPAPTQTKGQSGDSANERGLLSLDSPQGGPSPELESAGPRELPVSSALGHPITGGGGQAMEPCCRPFFFPKRSFCSVSDPRFCDQINHFYFVYSGCGCLS